MPYTNRKRQSVAVAASNKRRRLRIIIALGGKCVLCGYTGRRLELHHKDRRQSPGRKGRKDATLADLNAGLLTLVCFLCHRALSRLLYWKRLRVVDMAVTLAGNPLDTIPIRGHA